MIKLGEQLGSYERVKRYLKFRPNCRPDSDENAKKWLKYAGQVFLEQIREDKKKTSWEYLFQRKKDREQYISLYKRSKQVKWVTN